MQIQKLVFLFIIVYFHWGVAKSIHSTPRDLKCISAFMHFHDHLKTCHNLKVEFIFVHIFNVKYFVTLMICTCLYNVLYI